MCINSIHLIRSRARRSPKLSVGALSYAIVLGVAWATAGGAVAEPYPSRPITMVVPWAAGGPSDVLGRIIAEQMKVSLGQPVIVENVSGAGGSIGVARVARAAPDGYTLSLGDWSTHVVNGAVYALRYDLVTDFEPVSLLASTPSLIVAKNAVPAKDLRELIAWLRASQDKRLAGTAGIGSPPHVAGVYFQNITGARLQFLAYRGGGPAIQDLVSGHIDLMITAASNALPHVRSGTIRAYAVAAKTRLGAAPDIPTVDEAGLQGFYASLWWGLWMPSGTSKDVIARVNAAVVDALANPTVRQRLGDLALELPPREQQTPEALSAHQKAEIEKWWPIVKTANIRAD